METDYSKYDLAELRESAVCYKSKLEQIGWYYSTDAKAQLGSKNHPVPLEVVDAVTRFHNAIGNIDRDAVVAWLERFDYIHEDPIECVASTKTALNKLREGIRDYKDIARKIDPDVNGARRYCIDMANWLVQQIPILKERRRAAYAAPTDAEKEMLKDLLEWDIEEWLEEYIYLDADLSAGHRKRILCLALVTDGIDEHKRERLNQVLAQEEQETTKEPQEKEQAEEKSNATENGQTEENGNSIEVEEQALIKKAAKEKMQKLLRTANVHKDRIDKFIAEPQIEEPRDVAVAYEIELKLKGTGTTFKDFVECCVDFMGKQNVKGWNYNNIKTFRRKHLT